MTNYRTVTTSAEVFAVIMARHHHELKVFSSYSAPDGDQFGNSEKGKMFTSYGFEDADYPILEAETTWGISWSGKRENETHRYWLCIPVIEQ